MILDEVCIFFSVTPLYNLGVLRVTSEQEGVIGLISLHQFQDVRGRKHWDVRNLYRSEA